MPKRILPLLVLTAITFSLAGCTISASAEVSGASPSERPLSFVKNDIVLYCGMERQNVEAQAGKPDSTTTVNGTLFENYDGLLLHYIDNTIAVVKMESDSLWKTNEGIGLGSHADDLIIYPFDTSSQKNDVYSFTFQIVNDELATISWDEFNSTDEPESSFYLTINVNQSDTVYDLVVRDGRFMRSIFS